MRRISLKVRYEDNYKAKAAGATWDPSSGSWYWLQEDGAALPDGLKEFALSADYARARRAAVLANNRQFDAMFPDQKSALLYLEERRWPNGVYCPICASSPVSARSKRGIYRCYACSKEFTVRFGTIFENSKAPLVLWFRMLGLMVVDPDMSARRVHVETGIATDNVLSMQRRIREAIGNILYQEEFPAVITRILRYAPRKTRARADI